MSFWFVLKEVLRSVVEDLLSGLTFGITCFFHIMLFRFSSPVVCFHCTAGVSPKWKMANYTIFFPPFQSLVDILSVSQFDTTKLKGFLPASNGEGDKLSWVSWAKEWTLSKQRIVAETQTEPLKL